MSHPALRPVADTLGLLRLLLAHEVDEERRKELERAGTALGHALSLSRIGVAPDTIGGRALASHCEAAFTALDKMSWSDDVKGLIDAARERVAKAMRASEAPRAEELSREERRLARDRRNG